MNCMDKIQKAVEYFQDNSPDSPELNRVVGRRSASWQGRERDGRRDGQTDRQTCAACPPAARGWWACCLVKKVFGKKVFS